MQTDLPPTRDLVLIGGGHAHALLLLSWAMNPLPGTRVTLISPDPMTPYTGMLPGHVAGIYNRDELDIDLVKLCRHAGIRFTLSKATGLDRQNRHVLIKGQSSIYYDVLSIDIGIASVLPEVPGFAEFAVGAKPLGPFADEWAAFLDRIRSAKGAPRIVVVGGGVGGCELAMAMASRLAREPIPDATTTLVESNSRILDELSAGTRRLLLNRIRNLGIDVKVDGKVQEFRRDSVTLTDGRMIEADFVVCASGARAQDWLGSTGLELHDGFIVVDERLCSVSDARVFAAGDCIHMPHAPRVRAGVYAVRAAPPLLANLRAALSNGRLRSFRPQRDFLKLISTGTRHAVGEKWGTAFSGRWLWDVKDRIDRKFMTKFWNLPKMSSISVPAVAADGMTEFIAESGKLCGGCGSKIASGALTSALETCARPRRSDVLVGIGDDAAVVRTGSVTQVMATDHLRAFTDDPWVFSRIAAIHALGDIWSMGATPQFALASIVLPRMSNQMLRETLREAMAAASEVLEAEGAEIVGGHSSQGAELIVGFAVTGLVEGNPVGKRGARPGDRLILTKAIGSGTILAGEMARRAKGTDVASTFEVMRRPSGSAARLLSRHASAMTDVTGFGLAGHLMEMLSSSGVAATLDLASVPVLEGAETLCEQGVRSSIWKSNHEIAETMSFEQSPLTDLLFDPQTAGGLLAAVPEQCAKDLVSKLDDIGESAAEIGAIRSGIPWITVV